MSGFGTFMLAAAFAAALAAVACLLVGWRMGSRSAPRVLLAGRVACCVSVVALAVCCAALIGCFLAGDSALEYVVRYRSDSADALAWLYKAAGLWAGREGSLLLWAFLTALFGLACVVKGEARRRPMLDEVAAAVVFALVAAFVGTLLLSKDGNPFAALPAEYLDDSGAVVGVASLWGMSPLLEHWGMAAHPPLLFVGYAGFTVPFAYALSALLVGDPSNAWVTSSRKPALVAWLFLTAGIVVGAVWAYAVLGWGGYWGWDPVENASLLPWLCGVALVHSFTVCTRLGLFRRWTVLVACLTFAFVALDAFVTRSGVIGSVHAFVGDGASFALFSALAALPCALGGLGLAWRRRLFACGERALDETGRSEGSNDSEDSAASAGEKGPDASSGRDSVLGTVGFFSKIMAYHLNNLVMVGAAILLAYVTLAPALPAWLPLGGCVLPAGAYDSIAAPVGIAYLALLALCPVLSWARTDARRLWRRVRVPGVCAAVLFGALALYQGAFLVPRSAAALHDGAVPADSLLAQMPGWCCHGLATAGFFVASVLLFTSLFMGARGWRARRIPMVGGAIVHAGMAFLLVGLIGSTFYAIDEEVVLPYDAQTGSSGRSGYIGQYELDFVGMRTAVDANRTDLFNRVELEVLEDGARVAAITPAVQMAAQTQQQYFKSAIVHRPLEDVVVVYKGISCSDSGDADKCSLLFEIMINPFVSCVWVGFGVVAVGVAVALCGAARRAAEGAPQEAVEGGVRRGHG